MSTGDEEAFAELQNQYACLAEKIAELAAFIKRLRDDGGEVPGGSLIGFICSSHPGLTQTVAEDLVKVADGEMEVNELIARNSDDIINLPNFGRN